MQGIGYFKLYRELYHKPIWRGSTPEQKVILLTLLGMVNYKEVEWEHQGKRYTVKPGQCVTSIPSIVSECGKGISEQNVRTALNRFKKCGFLTDSPMTKNKNRLITIVNWEFYQGKNEGKMSENLTDTLTDSLTDNLTDKLTDSGNAETVDNKGIEGQTKNELTDTLTDDLTNSLTDDLNPSKEVNKLKNKNNMSVQQAEQFDFWWDLYSKKIGKAKCEPKFKALVKKYGYEVIEEGTKRYLEYLRVNNINKQFQKYPLTFLNGEHFMDEYEQTSTPALETRPTESIVLAKISYEED